MINISFIGMDIYMVGEIDRKIHSKLAKVYGVNEDDIMVFAFDSFVYHKGNEQTSFNLFIRVECSKELKEKQVDVANLLLEETKNYSIHATTYFQYFENESSIYKRVNNLYPRFLDGQEEDLSEEEYEQMDTYGPNGEEIYTGNIFENFDKEHPEDSYGSFEEDIEEETQESESYNVFANYKKN